MSNSRVKAEAFCENCPHRKEVLDPNSEQMIGLIVLTKQHKVDEPTHKPRLTVLCKKPKPKVTTPTTSESV